MISGLALPIIGIAIVDSLNPSLFIAQLVLLATTRPTTRVVTYIAGVLFVMLVGGVVILAGARQFVTDAIASIAPTTGVTIVLVIGIVILVAGWRMKWDAPVNAAPGQQPRSLHPIATFGFGMVVMVNEITTALPYFVALERIAAARVDLTTTAVLLILYNFVFALPLFGFLIAYLYARERFVSQTDAVNGWITKSMPRIAKITFIGVGAVLVLHGALFFMTGQGLWA
jgi:cytochrome c biogenesis protein CcdA